MTERDERGPIEPFRDANEEPPEARRERGPAPEEVMGAAAVTGAPIGSVEHGGAALAGFGAALGQGPDIAVDDDRARETPAELGPAADAAVAHATGGRDDDDLTEVAGPDDPDG